MLSHRLVLTFIITAVIAILVTDIRSSTVSSDSGSASYNFLVASGFLCEPNDSTTCPAVARAASGETIELNGAGTFTLANKSITAAGAFIHKSSTGEVVASGVWAVTELLSFQSYGLAPGALMLKVQKLKASRFFPLGLGVLAGPMPGWWSGIDAHPSAAGFWQTERCHLAGQLRTGEGSPKPARGWDQVGHARRRLKVRW